ncbi:MAG: hypothetical protein MK010_07155 [Erythrobacter sp.]|nr:hypothetical protein [Erythrobacter sp.]
MNLPKLDLDLLPDLDIATGLFGSLSDLASATTDDRVVVIMIYVYEMMPPDSFF